MRDFAAIDFETANNNPSSICSIGLVVVRNGEVVAREHRLVRPVPNFYTYFTTAVHGMTRRDTDFCVGFPLVWRELQPLFAGLPFVAHNAPFDERCLKAVHEAYGMPYPNYRFSCTCRIWQGATQPQTAHRICRMWLQPQSTPSRLSRCRGMCSNSAKDFIDIDAQR